MMKIILICITVIIALLIFISPGHMDGFLHPKVHITVLDRENKPIQGATVIFIEKVLEKDFQSNYGKYFKRFKNSARFKRTNKFGEALIDARFAVASHYIEIGKKRIHTGTGIFDDGILFVRKGKFKNEKILIDNKMYREVILNESIISIKISLEKSS